VRVTAEADAVVDHEKARQQVARPNSYIVLNPNRTDRHKTADQVFHVEDGAPLAESQLRLYQENKATVNQVAGVYQSMLGSSSEAKSGVAINSLMEQGTTTTAEITDNYLFSRRLVGELLLKNLIDDLADQQNHAVHIDSDDEQKVVVLNQVVQDEMGAHYANDITMINAKVVLDDVPSTPTFRQQQLRDLTELVKSMPPEIQMAVIPFVVEASDLSKRKEIVEAIKGVTGQGQGADDPEKAQMQQTIELLKKQVQALAEQPERIKAKASVIALHSKAHLDDARAEQIIEQTQAAQMGLVPAQDQYNYQQ
jgi:hypothetical protein